MTPARWVVAWAVAYSLLHHLGALPGGLGTAGGGTQWVDWVDLAVPYLVVGPALAALAFAGADRRAWVPGLAGAVAYASGHGIHLAANSISNERGDAAPVHLWDEVVGHGSGTPVSPCSSSPSPGRCRCAGSSRSAGCWQPASV